MKLNLKLHAFLPLFLYFSSIVASTESLEEESTNLEPGWNIPRIVAIGDLHGSFKNAIKVLKLAKLIDIKNKTVVWVGGRTTLVQTGDVVDRGPDTIKLYRMLKKLKEKANLHGGEVVSLLGNHEVMNLMEDYRYVTKEDILSFGSEVKRKQIFGKDGWIGQYLRNLNITAIVEDTVFCHGGIKLDFARRGIKPMNEETRKLLQEKSIEQLWHVDLFGNNGPLWYRGYALDKEDIICPSVDMVLSNLKVKRMVMGHTVQQNGKINTRCNGKVILIDTGISDYYGSNLAALQLTPNESRAMYKNSVEVLQFPGEEKIYVEEVDIEGKDKFDEL